MSETVIPLLPDAAALDIAARTVLGEARSEGRDGLVAVLWTIMNRVLSGKGWWGRSHLAVCLWPKQFSCWNDGDPNRKWMLGLGPDHPDYLLARELAKSVFIGQIPDPTGGATHYINPDALAALPDWARDDKRLAVIGRHHFYRPEA